MLEIFGRYDPGVASRLRRIFFEKLSKTDPYGRRADKPGLPPNAALVTRG